MSSEQQADSQQSKTCPKCGGGMKWFRSEADKALNAVQHVFTCNDCGSLDTVTGPMTGGANLGIL